MTPTAEPAIPIDIRQPRSKPWVTRPPEARDDEAIAKTLQHYIDGARTGKGDAMKPAFHEDATIFGYVGDDPFAGPIQGPFDWTGHRFTDLFTLPKVDGEWKIMNNVFRLHS